MKDANKVAALARLALVKYDQPEGDVAKQKLAVFLEKEPALRSLPDVVEFLETVTGISKPETIHSAFFVNGSRCPAGDFNNLDEMSVGTYHQRGGSVEGSWTATDFKAATTMMAEEFDFRMRQVWWERMMEAGNIPPDATVEDVLGG